MKCDHKNLKTVNDMLLCKDCGQQLPLSFLTDRGKKKSEDEAPSPAVQTEDDQESVSSEQKQVEKPPVEAQTEKSSTAKKPRKNAKKGA